MSPTSYQAALPRVIPSLLSATLIIIPYSNSFVKRVRKVFLQRKQRAKTRLLTFFPENQQPRQFTPLREGRPDGMLRRAGWAHFNSRPSARGDANLCAMAALRDISIHAPPRGATFRSGRCCTFGMYFNSRPSARGDVLTVARRNAASNFNSRPSTRGDEAEERHDGLRLFQFTPLREGRPPLRGGD